jgi:hypothetical protein
MIDLKALAFDGRYQIDLDPSADQEPRSEWPWLWRIPCRHGFIGVHSADRLLAHCHSSRIAPRLLAVPDVIAKQVGDREVNCVFPPERLHDVAEVLIARRKRRLSAAQRDRVVAALRPHWFTGAQGAKRGAGMIEGENPIQPSDPPSRPWETPGTEAEPRSDVAP